MLGAALDVENLAVRYGDLTAISQVSVSIPAGSVTAILGSNGSGKSTFARAVSGLVPVHAGRLMLDGRDITGQPAHHLRRLGLAYLPEGRGVFPGLSVFENLRMAARLAGKRSERQAAVERAYELFPVLYERRSVRAGLLSGGEQQMLALARALTVKPRLIIADELSLGLAPRIVARVYERVESISDEGITVVIIEQFVNRALAMASHCVVMAQGRLAWEGSPDDASEQVLERYLGAAPTA